MSRTGLGSIRTVPGTRTDILATDGPESSPRGQALICGVTGIMSRLVGAPQLHPPPSKSSDFGFHAPSDGSDCPDHRQDSRQPLPDSLKRLSKHREHVIRRRHKTELCVYRGRVYIETWRSFFVQVALSTYGGIYKLYTSRIWTALQMGALVKVSVASGAKIS